MEIKKLVFTQHAINTFEREFDYIKENRSVTVGDNFRKELKAILEPLNKDYLLHPECRALPTKNQKYRNVIWGSYLIVYKIMAKEVFLLGLFHTSRNPKKLKAFRRIKE